VAAKPNVDFDIAGGSAGGSSESAAAPAPDFDLDIEGQKHPAAAATDLSAAEAAPSIDFDLAPSSQSAAPAVDVSTEAPKEEKSGFDFDLSGLDFPSSKPAAAAETPAPAAKPSGSSLDLADLSLDSGAESGGEAVGTKLELAKAYLEIGDKDGAREILQEVAKEGSSAQKEEAKKLIASL
jgi:pilus assembly protein FimV